MGKQINSVLLLFFLAVGSVSYSQVGMGTENPTEEFETVGTMRFCSLEEQSLSTHNREVRSDDEGRLTSIQNQAEGLYFNNLIKQFMGTAVSVTRNTPEQDLGVKITFELEPKSQTMVILSYNIPAYVNTTITNLPLFAGVHIMRKSGGSTKKLEDGSRKFSFPSSFRIGSQNLTGMFVDGKYVDVLVNQSSEKQTIEYSLTGFIETTSATTVFFSDNASSSSFGVGIFSAMIFNKTF